MDFALATSTLLDLNAAKWINTTPDDPAETRLELKKDFKEEIQLLAAEIEKTQKSISLQKLSERFKFVKFFKSYRKRVLYPDNGLKLITYAYCLKEYIDLKYGYLCDKSITELTNDDLYFLDFFSALLHKDLDDSDLIIVSGYCAWFVEGGRYANRIRAGVYANLDELKEKLKLVTDKDYVEGGDV